MYRREIYARVIILTGASVKVFNMANATEEALKKKKTVIV